MKKIQRVNFDEGFEILAENAKNMAGEVTAKGLYALGNNSKLIQGTLLLNAAGLMFDSELLDNVIDIANAVTATKVAFDFINTEVEEPEEPASDKPTDNSAK